MDINTKINHIAFVTSNQMLAGRFYQALFGLDPWGSTPPEDRGLHATDGYVGVAILQRNPGRKAGFDHWGFEVDDVAAVRDHVAKHYPECKTLTRPSNRPFASVSMNDPAGNVFDISQEGMSNRRGPYTEKRASNGNPTISHFTLRTMDVARLAEFYSDAFGLKEVSSDDKRAVSLSDGTVQMVLLPWDIDAYSGGGLERSPGLDHFGFRVNSTAEFETKIRRLTERNPLLAPQTLDATNEQKVRRDLLASCHLGTIQLGDPDGVLIDASE